MTLNNGSRNCWVGELHMSSVWGMIEFLQSLSILKGESVITMSKGIYFDLMSVLSVALPWLPLGLHQWLWEQQWWDSCQMAGRYCVWGMNSPSCITANSWRLGADRFYLQQTTGSPHHPQICGPCFSGTLNLGWGWSFLMGSSCCHEILKWGVAGQVVVLGWKTLSKERTALPS